MDEDPPELPTKLKLKVTAIREPLSELPPEDSTKLQLRYGSTVTESPSELPLRRARPSLNSR
jgi:hypothetical protein